MRAGHVYLVGAGPGDPGLLTLRGREVLERADVVLFDRLVSDEVLGFAPPHALLIDAGKGTDGHGMSQEQIHGLLVEHARAGRWVVRLKGGDPTVFGRASEEVEACRAAGVGCDVVPGVSSAIAGPAAAGIPVTARGVARSFAVVTARSAAGSEAYRPDYDALVKIDTLVVLMGCKELPELAAGLIAAGKDPATPAALVERATWPTQRLTTATLATVATAAVERAVRSPVLLVIGPTAGWGSTGDEQAALPLSGRRIVTTRPRTASADLVRRLRSLGADVIEVPLIRMDYPEVPPAIDRETLRADWVVFTSLHGVRGFFRALAAAGLDARALGGARIAAVGDRTAAEIRSVARLNADLVPTEQRAAGLVRELRAGGVAGGGKALRVLFPCGSLAREELPEGLRAAGMAVQELEVYQTHPRPPETAARRELEAGVDAILLYSPSGVKTLAAHHRPAAGTLLVAVGPTTAAAVRESGLGEAVVPAVYGDDGVIAELVARLGR